MKQQEVLLTGGFGNLGTWVLDHLVKKDYKVTVLANSKRDVDVQQGYETIYADISDFDSLNKSLARRTFNCVIHLASVNDGFVPNYYQLANKVNALGTRNLLEWIKDNPDTHFIYFSTFQVYGKYESTIDESTPTLPKHDYGSTHLFAEVYVKQFHKTHQLPYTIFRLTNSYGCPKDLDSSKWYLVLNDLSRSAVKDKKIVLKSNGKARRDFIWMGDVADIIEKSISQPGNDTYNISGQETYSMLDIAQKVQTAYEEEYGEKIPIETNETDTTIHPENLFVSSEKLRRKISINDTIAFKQEAKKIFKLLNS